MMEDSKSQPSYLCSEYLGSLVTGEYMPGNKVQSS